MINPYAGVDWTSCIRVASVSHAHCNKEEDAWAYQDYLDNLHAAGIRHMAISGYYPSKPTYPLADFFTVPDDVLASPNAEHHHMTDASDLHCNSIGSTFASGKASRTERPVGVNTTWRRAFAQIIDALQYKDGGGITINHPTWTGLPVALIERFLDFSPAVLGIEIFNASTEESSGKGWALDTWDALLKTGRRCWGFAVPDHAHKTTADFKGRTCLLVKEATERACLMAYRDGAFYSQVGNTALTFDRIALNGRALTVETHGADSISVIIDGKRKTFTGNACTLTVPAGAVYARVEAASDDDAIYSNPIVFRPRTNRRASVNPLLILS